jgi:AcrR family transcriptional regulator
MAERMRSDAVRSRRKIIEAATTLIAEQGPDVSMDAIARSADVGSATLYRHFPNRAAVLDELFTERTTVLCDHARDLAGSCEPQDALRRWLHRLARDAVEQRGLAAAAFADGGRTTTSSSCHERIEASALMLVQAAQASGSLRPDVTADDLLALINGIILGHADGEDPAWVERMVGLVLDGAARSGAWAGGSSPPAG